MCFCRGKPSRVIGRHRAQGAARETRQPAAGRVEASGIKRHGSFQATCPKPKLGEAQHQPRSSQSPPAPVDRPIHPRKKRLRVQHSRHPPTPFFLPCHTHSLLQFRFALPAARVKLDYFQPLSAACAIMDAPEPDTPFAAVSAQTTKYGQVSLPATITPAQHWCANHRCSRSTKPTSTSRHPSSRSAG